MSQTNNIPTSSNLYEYGVRRVAHSERTMLPVPACPVCDATRARRHLEIEGLSQCVTVCNECGLGRLHPLPDPEAVRGY